MSISARASWRVPPSAEGAGYRPELLRDTAVIFGFLAGPPVGTFAGDLAKHFQKSIAIRGSDIYTYFRKRPDAFQVDLAKVFGLLDDGILRRMTSVLTLDQAAEAHRTLEAGEVMGKLVLHVD